MSTDSAKHDLTAKIIPFVDRHLALPMIDFLIERKVYPENELAQLKYSMLSETKMIDVIIDEHKKINKTEDVPAALTEEKAAVLKEMDKLKKSIGNLASILDKSKFTTMKENNEITFDNLSQHHGVTLNNVKALYKYGRLMFNVGMYRDSYIALSIHRLLADNDEDSFMALWGKFAAGLVDGEDWDAVLEDARLLRESIDQRTKISAAEQVQQRTWFLHWMLFFTFHHAGARSLLLDCLHNFNANNYNPQNNEKMLNVVQLNAPHLLRYLTVAAVISARQPLSNQQFLLKRTQNLRELVRVIAAEKSNYSDPLTEFIHNLLTEFDFAAAAKSLNECVAILQNDFFLSSDNIQKEFYEAARALFVDTYARVHTEVEVKSLLAKYQINLPLIEAVNSEIKLSAPSIMKTNPIHQQIRERARNLVSRYQRT